MRDIDVWYARFDIEAFQERFRSEATKKQLKNLDKEMAKARGKDSMRALSRLSRRVNGRNRIVQPLVDIAKVPVKLGVLSRRNLVAEMFTLELQLTCVLRI